MVFKFNSKLIDFILGLTLAIIITGFARLQLINGYPETDGGFYTYLTQLTFSLLSNGENLPGNMPIGLYPFITSWVYSLQVDQYILLRIIDLFVAIFASFLFFKVILKESGSIFFTLALLIPVLIIMNDIEFVGSGFKNSIWISYVPLFAALLLWQNLKKEDNLIFYFIGALTALGVLFREPFLVFFILGGVSIWIAYGWKNLLKYLIGTAILGFTITGIAVYLRGGDIVGLIGSYLNIDKKTADVSEGIIKGLFFHSGMIVLKKNIFIVITALISIVYIIVLSFQKKIKSNRYLFWLSLSFIPLLEPALKFGFPYHFATCIPGLAGLSALSWKLSSINQTKQFCKYLKGILCISSILIVYPNLSNAVKEKNITSITDAYNMVYREKIFRNETNIINSNYLIFAKTIFENSREDSTLAVSGQMHALFPLTGMLPPNYLITDLRDLFSILNFNEALFIKKIKEYQPTLLMVIADGAIKGEAELPRLIKETNLYEKIAIIPYNKDIDYGWKHGSIYRLKTFNK
tara:strand:- start:430 stop:1992 length:1563 start_codon:yes stop_codon:yes gene_type:complete